MSRKVAPGTLIHCEYCGEDYSATYKRCPFCGEKPSSDAVIIPPPSRRRREEAEDEYVFEGQELFDQENPEEEELPRPPRSKGGKRLAQNQRSQSAREKIQRSPKSQSSGGGGSRSASAAAVNWPRLITFICSLVIIAAALIIVFAYIYPKVHDPNSGPAGSAVSPSPSVSGDPDASAQPTPIPTPSPTTAPTEPPAVAGTVVNAPSGLRVRSGPGTSYEKVGALKNGNRITVVSDAGDGWCRIIFENNGVSTPGYIQAKYIDAEGEIPAAASSAAPAQPSQSPDASSEASQPPAVSTPAPGFGGAGRITGAATGLRVRSGPGTDYDVVGSLRNGDAINVLSDAGNGWFEITFVGSNGSNVTGYIMEEFISIS